MTVITPEAVIQGLADVLAEVAGVAPEKVVREAMFDFHLDVDSLTMVEVVVACEERFDVRIPDEALEKLRTVGDAVDYITTAGSVPA
ncbi:MAG: acyl carrier protein [Frankiales bacterium]|jgi:acyl carrier protein|nr:acyl carrier protein [Frankiales bacterium]